MVCLKLFKMLKLCIKTCEEALPFIYLLLQRVHANDNALLQSATKCYPIVTHQLKNNTEAFVLFFSQTLNFVNTLLICTNSKTSIFSNIYYTVAAKIFKRDNSENNSTGLKSSPERLRNESLLSM